MNGGRHRGLIVWILVGIIAALLGTFLARQRHWARKPIGFSVAIGAAVLGGFIADLSVRGDSVAHFKGPTVIGSLIGVGIAIGLAYFRTRRTATQVHS